MFRTITGFEIMQGSVVPWNLGRCYYDINSDCEILAPLPLNFLIGWSYEAWYRLRRGPEGIRQRLEAARSAGFREGLEAGKQQSLFAFDQARKLSRHHDISSGERSNAAQDESAKP